MTNRYANFYAARPAMTEKTLRTQYAILAENHSADWFLGAVSRRNWRPQHWATS
jgi:hypothetical protein